VRTNSHLLQVQPPDLGMPVAGEASLAPLTYASRHFPEK
jgi:hypothetical protein